MAETLRNYNKIYLHGHSNKMKMCKKFNKNDLKENISQHLADLICF